MSRRLSRISLVLVLFLSSEVWALGLGDIQLESALGEPLRAEIELLSAAPEELDNLAVALASADTFARYGLDRPFYLQGITFAVIRSGRADGNVVQLRSQSPISEPFLTFLVEATWSRGRLLREYTVLLDPPTYAPPPSGAAQAVQAPSRSTPADSGQIQRPGQAAPSAAPPPAPRPAAQLPAEQPQALPEREPAPRAQPAQPLDDRPFETAAGGDYRVERGETLWGIASRVRPDNRLTMNQTMLAIFEANPAAFGGNINILRAGAALRIPSADDIFRISRSDALAEAQRQHAEWSGGRVVSPAAETRPSLTLVPPDEDYVDQEPAPVDTDYETEPYAEEPEEPVSREEEILQRIADLEAADVPQQQSLIEIRDNELAALRAELAEIRGETIEPGVEEVSDEAVAEESDAAVEPEEAAEPEETVAPAPSTIIRTPTQRSEPSLVDRVLGILTEWWMIIVGVVVIVGGALFWFMRRGGEEDEPDAWRPLDADEGGEDFEATESMRAPVGDESIVVVEQDAPRPRPVEAAPAAFSEPDVTIEAEAPAAEESAAEGTGQFGSLEDTFSSETAVNLDQSDPIAEADFHMAYGLYDQAADLVNGALEVEPQRHDLLTKLCEIYFVWGNRDAFIDAAGKLKAAVGDSDSADWDKIVIMGQQIAGEDELFSGASAAGATKAVDLEFDGDMHDTGALDMELIADASGEVDILDIGSADADESAAAASGEEGIDFFIDSEVAADAETEVASLDLDATAESPTVESETDFDITREMPGTDQTAEMPTVESPLDTPTIEEQFATLGGTSELPSLDESLSEAIEESGHAGDETAEINLDDLNLDVDGLDETELASFDDFEETGSAQDFDADDVTGRNEALDDDATGLQEALSGDETGLQEALSADDTSINETLDETTFVGEATDETTMNEALDESLLDATGLTQVLSSDLAVDTTTDAGAELGSDDATLLAGLDDDEDEASIDDDQETLLASLDDDDDSSDFDFAKTEALPKEAFTGDYALEETGEMPAVASTDVDLDLDDLTAALKVSEDIGDTVEQPRDDATVQQPRPKVPDDEDAATLSLGPEDMSDDLHEARTMTEVGTKLDLARAYVDMGDPSGARSILEEVLDEGDEAQRQQAQQLLDTLPG